MRSRLRVGLFLPVAVGLWPAAAHGQDTVGRPELVSPPGWFGPGPAWHKWSDPGPGFGWHYYGVPDGPYVTVPPDDRRASGAYIGGGYGYWPGWGVPSYAGSFWTNGQSLYGPPVPTYGPIPGVFGGSDAGRHFFKAPPPTNSVWFGLGWAGYRSPSPRCSPVNVSVNPQPPAAPPAVAADGGRCIRLAVRLPDPNADVWVENALVTQKGAERQFESPPLQTGVTYRYEVIARWKENGRDRAESRTATGTAGQTLDVDFTKPAEAPAVAGK
jgi:uncharacterized protein (TIGR03000 family)